MGEVGLLERPAEQLQSQEPAMAADIFFNREATELQAYDLVRNRHNLPEVTVQRAEYVDNARTALMEALTASGHLSRVELHGSIEEINRQVLNRLLNGYSESLPLHEQERRFQEICEELQIQELHKAIVAGVLPPNTALGIISDVPTVEMPGIGYRYENKKGMVRSTHLRDNQDGTYTRVIEQVSRSNSGYETTYPFLSSCGIEPGSSNKADIQGLRSTFIYSEHDYIDGVVDVQRRLDHFAGADALYGDKESVTPEHAPYRMLRQESARREEEIEAYIGGLADLEAGLDKRVAKGMNQQEAVNIFQGEVYRILKAICGLNPGYAEATFGKDAAPAYHQASVLIAAGRHIEAGALLDSLGYLEKPITFCGMTISVKEAKDLGLEVNEFGELVEKGKESWKWKQGVCQVKSCPTRPDKTEVGPCNVCRDCQARFDEDDDPTKDKEPEEVPGTRLKAPTTVFTPEKLTKESLN